MEIVRVFLNAKEEKEILVEFRLNQNGLNVDINLFLSYLFFTVFGIYIDFALMILIVLS